MDIQKEDFISSMAIENKSVKESYIKETFFLFLKKGQSIT